MKNNSDTLEAIEQISQHLIANVILNKITGQKALLAATRFYPGDVICRFHAGSIHSTPTYLTVQTGDDKHITLQPEFLQYINHSCDPNVFFDTTTMELVCIKPMETGDEFTFFYPSTEWDMAQPFECHCGSTNCLGTINGAAKLSKEVLENYKLTDYIREKKRKQ